MTEEWGEILVVDDDAEMRELVHDVFKERGHQITMAGSGQEALKLLAEQDYAVVVTDLRMKGMQGTELLAEIRRLYPDIGVILMTGFGSVDTAVEAMKRGASDYLTKPVKNDELVRVVERSIREASLRREVNRLRREVHKEYSFHQIIGKSKPMQEIFDLIRRVADSPTNLLITGESGTGKELVAKAIHYNSDRQDAPFIPVNCAAIPEQLLESELFGHMRGAFTDAKMDKRGLFEEAQKGTLFLDEISELPLMLQAKILRAIQEKEIRRVGANKPIAVDVRIIAATNLNLTEEVKAKRFREDLYYRLNVIELRLPPLRERREDILLLVDAFMKKCAESRGKQIQGVSEPALAMLVDYAWPGNVRELENVIERAVTLSRSERIVPDDLPPTVQGARGDRRVLDDAAEQTLPLDEVEKEYILKILEKTGGNKYQAAHMLGIDRKTLYRKLGEIEGEDTGVSPESFDSEEQFRLIVEAAPNGMLLVDESGTIVMVNASVLRQFGYEREEVLGKSVEMLIPGPFRSDHRQHRAGFINAPQTRSMGGGRELFGLRKDGSEVPVEIGLTPIQTITGMGVLASILDISERKRLEMQLRRTERLAELGTLASGMAHEIGTPMNVILGRAEYLLQRTADEGMKKGLTTIVKQVERITKVMNQLLAFARRRMPERRAVDLGEIVDDSLEMFQERIVQSRITVDKTIESSLPPVCADRDQLIQVLINLVMNSIHAMPEGGRLGLSLARENSHVRLGVSDTGHGMPEEIRSKVFEPFFTTKDFGKGTGLGLTVVKGIIEEHGGTIGVESVVDKGTTFWIRLPLDIAQIAAIS